MTPELTALALAALLQVLQFCAFSVAGTLQVGTKKGYGPRDMPIILTGKPGRIHRAMNNHFEGLILFTISLCRGHPFKPVHGPHHSLRLYLSRRAHSVCPGLCLWLGAVAVTYLDNRFWRDDPDAGRGVDLTDWLTFRRFPGPLGRNPI